jgi:hypothetical protein
MQSEELLVVVRNEPGMSVRITEPLVRNNITIKCFTSYAWGNEAAFRFVTDNNWKAREILLKSGFNVQEHSVALWYMDNMPGAFGKAAAALADGHVDTYCSYMTTAPNAHTTIVAFSTNNTYKTITILNEIS